MITLHNKDFTIKYGAINSVIEAFVEEERNGLFELSFVVLNTDSLFKYIEKDNIVVANANNTLLNQKFRIYMTRKLMNNRVEVFARHISFDLMHDYIDNVSFENQSCEYALNQLFMSSQFSKHYKGYSDIINAQNYSMSMANVLEAIGGKEGSLLDTFGTGAELLRDNENIYILNKRGHDNSVTIEYKKNLTGFELEEDTTDLVTRILPYARYTTEDGEEITIKGNFVDSPLIANYSHPYVKAIDYTDKFREGEVVTVNKLTSFAEIEFRDNRVDVSKQNFKISFMPLSKCVGYEGLEDNISLCDIVTIKDSRYNVNTQAKVIKTTFNVLKNRYESMELGEPRTSLGDIIGSNDSSKGEQGPPGPQGPPGADGSIGDFPDSLPATPVVTATVYGFANIEISWTFENKVYYQYEVYASKEANFTPNTFNLIHQGQTSTFMYQAKPNETWYFKVCCVNTHGERTNFGSAYATTSKVDDLSNYVSNMAIDDALIGTLRLDRGWIGTLRGNYIDAKQLSVTDGNGKRTLDIDSFGNVNLSATNIKMLVGDKEEGVVSESKLTQTSNEFEFAINNTKIYNEIRNSSFMNSFEFWSKSSDTSILELWFGEDLQNSRCACLKIPASTHFNKWSTLKTEVLTCKPNTYYSIGGRFGSELYPHGQSLTGNIENLKVIFYNSKNEYIYTETIFEAGISGWFKHDSSFMTPANATKMVLERSGKIGGYGLQNETTLSILTDYVYIKEGHNNTWTQHKTEVYNNITRIDDLGVKVEHQNGSYTRINSEELYQANESGMRTASMRYGAYRVYKWEHDMKYVGSTSVLREGNENRYGIGTYGTDDAWFVDLAMAEGYEGDGNLRNVTPYIRCAKWDIDNSYAGVNVFKPLHVQNVANFDNYIKLKNFGADNEIYKHCIGGESDTESNFPHSLSVIGDRGVSLRFLDYWGNNHSVLAIEKESDTQGKIHAYGNINMNGYAINNVIIENQLVGNSRYSLKNHLAMNTYNTSSTSCNEIRHRGNAVTENLKCLIEIPQVLSENLIEYDVFISKNDFGDYRIKEKNNYYFEIETTKDFEFSYEIVGTIQDLTNKQALNNLSYSSEKVKEIQTFTMAQSNYALKDEE